SVEHTEDQQNTGNHKKPDAPDKAGPTASAAPGPARRTWNRRKSPADNASPSPLLRGESRGEGSAEADEPAGRPPQHLVVAHHRAAADDGRHRPAGDLHAGERGPAAGRDDPGFLDPPPPPQVDQGEIRVIAGRQPTLAERAVDPRGPGAEQVHQP